MRLCLAAAVLLVLVSPSMASADNCWQDGKFSLDDAGGLTDCLPYVCSSSSGLCRTTCESSSDCSPGYACNASACRMYCDSDANCSPGYTCVDNYCVPANAICSKDGTTSDGPRGLVVCAPYLCDPRDGHCPTGCASDGDCQSGLVCSSSLKCVTPAPSVDGSGCQMGYGGDSWSVPLSVLIVAAVGGANGARRMRRRGDRSRSR
jgi:hypothetical protein